LLIVIAYYTVPVVVAVQSCVERLQTPVDCGVIVETARKWESRPDWFVVGASLAARVEQMQVVNSVHPLCIHIYCF